MQENPAELSADELAIVAGWKHAMVGQFYIFRYLSKYTIFLSSGGKPNKAYGVLALADPFEELVGPYLPRLIHAVCCLLRARSSTTVFCRATTLLRRRRQANAQRGVQRGEGGVWDHHLAAGGRTAAEETQEAAENDLYGSSWQPLGRGQGVLDAVVQMTDAFCKQFLNEEYAELCRKLAETLARKRPSPLLSGRLETWASGIVRTIGWVNFLHDPSQTPHLTLSSIDEAFGIAESTGAAKLKTIRTMLRIHQFDPKWTLPSKMDDNPLVWMLQVNGFLMDIRHAPRELQEAAFEKGLIPYIPADREEISK